ncbi:allergin-1 isoform X4 [Pleurodeles waltl]|uniref:allergin-1 isoform X4 n=1 Tax=Pleurodeles waltl TaxID=8319 RepID=UPI00370970E2
MQTHPFLPHTAEWFFMRPQRRSEMFPALIIPLLLVKFQTTQEQASNDAGAVSQPELWSKSTFAAAGQNVTLSCFTANGGLPITYELFKMDTIQKTVVVRERNGTAKFTVLVKNITDVGEYKCTAQNNFTTAKQYSKGLNLSLAEPVSKPKLYSNTSSTAVGHNVTLFCVADSGSLPINYSFFRGETFLSLQTRNDRLPATLTINLNSPSCLWIHKCKAENMLSGLQQYSASFNFTLEVKDPSSMWLVICPVIVTVILLLIFILAFPLFILPRCKARKNNTSTVGNTASAKKSSALPASDESNYDAESTAQQGEVEYTTVFITNGNKVMERNDSEVQYSEILVRKSN